MQYLSQSPFYAFFVGRGISRPLTALVALLQKLAAGDYAVEIDGADRKDEIGDVARTARVFRDNGLAKLRMEQERIEAERRVAADRELAAASKLRMEQERNEAEKRAAADRELAAADKLRMEQERNEAEKRAAADRECGGGRDGEPVRGGGRRHRPGGGDGRLLQARDA